MTILEPGMIIYGEYGFGRSLEKYKITRVTKASAFAEREGRVIFRFKREVPDFFYSIGSGGSSFSRSCFNIRSAELDARYEKEQLLMRVKSQKFQLLEVPELQQIVDILNKWEKEYENKNKQSE